MTLRIADLCLGTDKDWKVGKTKIFLKVRGWEALAASGLLGTAGGKERAPPAMPTPGPSWAVGSSSHRFVHWLACPVVGIWDLDWKEVIEIG